MGSRTILIVEDDVDIRESIAEFLRDEHYDVKETSDGQQALDYLRNNDAPGLILLDLMMPNVNGFQFRELQLSEGLHEKTPLIVMSAHANIQTEFDKIVGGKGYLRKPLNIEMLLITIKKYF